MDCSCKSRIIFIIFCRGRTFSSGCYDAFTVFAFLAFLLALLDLILELQMMRRRRRKREERDDEKNATLAANSILRGFLNTVDTKDEHCAKRFYCEGAQAAAKNGEIGRKMARIAR